MTRKLFTAVGQGTISTLGNLNALLIALVTSFIIFSVLSSVSLPRV
jgi:hypothetical protein